MIYFFISIIKKIKIFEQPQDQIFEVMVDKPNNYSLDWLAKQAHLSPRQLERKFNQYIGICPKFFARIIRFEQSYNLRLQNLNKDWLSIAILSGYYDYQHLVKDYKEFVNASPNQFFTEEEKAPGRMLGLTKPGIFNWLRKES